MKILAIDMGKSKSVACVYQLPEGQESYHSLPTAPKDFYDWIVKSAADLVVIEIGPLAGWVRDLCEALGQKLLVANTSDEPWRWRNVKSKSDRKDALKLAQLAGRNEIQNVWVPEKKVRQWRELIGYRQMLVDEATAIKNRIRILIEQQGQSTPRGYKAWTEAGRKQLQQESKELSECGPEELWRGMLQVELKRLEEVEGHVQAVEKKLEERGQAEARVGQLKTAPAVGPRLAEMVVAWIDEPRRFGRGREVGCYAGLTPRRYQSGQMDRQGHISRAGSGLLRRLLVQVSWIGIRQGGWMREVYERARAGSEKRKKLAIVAVARRLLVRLWAMLRDGTVWREEVGSASPLRKTALA